MAACVYTVPSREHCAPLTGSVSKLSVQSLISSALLSFWSTAIWAVLGVQETEGPSLVSGGGIASQRSYSSRGVLGTEFSCCVGKEFNIEKNLPCCSVLMGLGCHPVELGLENRVQGITSGHTFPRGPLPKILTDKPCLLYFSLGVGIGGRKEGGLKTKKIQLVMT